jgi:hypothetical protein
MYILTSENKKHEMKTVKYIQSKIAFPLALVLLTLVGCERDLSDEVVFATFPTTAEIFTDAPVGLTDEFFISFDPAVGANTEGFGTDENEFFEGTSSIRIDVPSPSDPDGNFIGGIFRDRGEGRDLSGYDALTFWAKGSLTGTILVGFGTDFITDTYPVSTQIQLTAGWRKYTIPIPNAARLTQERGMFLFSAGSFDALGNDNPLDGDSFNDNIGYTFWMDEMRFEKLGTTDMTSSSILGGQDQVVNNFVGYTQTIADNTATFNLANGQNITVNAAPAYFDFTSSDMSVATVTPTGDVSVGGVGSTEITATLAGEVSGGSLTINATGAFVNAPDPTLPASDVIAIYSDSYTNIAGYNPAIFADSNVGPISLQSFSGNEHINYSSINAFLGMGWDGTVDASGATMMHIDIQLVGSTSLLKIEIEDFGANGADEPPFTPGSDDNSGGFDVTSQLVDGQWVSFDIPLNSFTLPTGGGGSGSPATNALGYITLVSNPANPAGILVDNIYFY